MEYSRWRRSVWWVQRWLGRHRLAPSTWAYLGLRVDTGDGQVRTIVAYQPPTMTIDRRWSQPPGQGESLTIRDDRETE